MRKLSSQAICEYAPQVTLIRGIKKIPVLLTEANKRFSFHPLFCIHMDEDAVSFIIEGSHQGVKNLIVLMSHNKESVFVPSRIGASWHWYTNFHMSTTREVYTRLPRQRYKVKAAYVQ